LQIAKPTQKKSLIKEVSEEGRAWFRDAIVPWKSIDEGAETERMRIATDGNIRQSELVILGTAVSGSQRIAGEALNKEPTVVTVPAEPAAAAP
jgi:hypothetical protein